MLTPKVAGVIFAMGANIDAINLTHRLGSRCHLFVQQTQVRDRIDDYLIRSLQQ